MVALKKETTGYPPLSFNAVLKGLMAALIITILGCAIFGVVYHVTALSEKTLPLTTGGLFYFSVFAGSLYAAREAGFKGLVHGIGVAVLFVIVGWFLAKAILHVNAAFFVVMQKTIVSCIAGAVGGILGVGLSK